MLDQTEIDSAYSAISSDVINGKIILAGCTHMPNMPAVIYELDIMTNKLSKYLDTSIVLPVDNKHGKIHTKIIIDKDQNSYCATHFAYPYGLPQPINYSGSRLIRIGVNNEHFDLGLIKEGNGAIDIAIDQDRNLIYILTIPDANLIRYDIKAATFVNLGKLKSNKAVSRSLAVDRGGNVFGCYEEGGLFVYRPDTEILTYYDHTLPAPTGTEWNSSSRGGVNRLDRSMWRSINYCSKRDLFFGHLSSDSQAFSLDPKDLSFRVGDRLYTGEQSENRKSKIFPTLSLTADTDCLLYATSTGLFDYSRSEHIEGWVHLLSIDKDTLKSTDLGIIEDNDRKVFGIMAAALIHGEFYGIGAVEHKQGEINNIFNVINGMPFMLAVIRIKY